MYTLMSETKAAIKNDTGISVDDIINMDVGDIHSAINEKVGKPLAFRYPFDRKFSGRGSVYLALNRLRSVKDMDKIIAKI